MTIHIRLYTTEDRAFITSLIPRFSEFELPEWRSKEEIDQTNQAALNTAIDRMEPDSVIFIAEDETGHPAGFIRVETQTDYFDGEKVGYISDLAVSKAFEGKGVGRILMDAAEEWTAQHGYEKLTLYVFAGNSRAQKIYEKRGFKQEVIKYVKPIR